VTAAARFPSSTPPAPALTQRQALALALGWLEVACNAMERAEEFADLARGAADATYRDARDAMARELQERRYLLRVETATLEMLARQRGAGK